MTQTKMKKKKRDGGLWMMTTEQDKKYFTLPETNLVLELNKAGDFLKDINRSKTWIDNFGNTSGHVEGFMIRDNRLWYYGCDLFGDEAMTWPNMPQPTLWTTDRLIPCNEKREIISTEGWGEGLVEEDKPRAAVKKKRKKRKGKGNSKSQSKINLD